MKTTSLTHWFFIIKDPRGNIKSRSKITPNLNTQEGAINFLDTYYNLASGYSAAWFVGLCVGTVNPDYTDTAAKITTGIPNPPTTNDWKEFTGYTGNRKSVIWGNVNDHVLDPDLHYNYEVDNLVNLCEFVTSGGGTLEGGFLTNEETKGSTSGILYAIDNNAGSLTFNGGDSIHVGVLTGFKGGVG